MAVTYNALHIEHNVWCTGNLLKTRRKRHRVGSSKNFNLKNTPKTLLIYPRWAWLKIDYYIRLYKAHALSSAEASLCRREAERKKKRGAGHDGKRQEIERPFPSSYCPPRAFYFSIIAIFIWIPRGSLCGGGRSPRTFSTSLISVSTIGNTSYIL